jgi:hypothetical protein
VYQHAAFDGIFEVIWSSFPQVIHMTEKNWWKTLFHLLDIICYNRSGAKWGILVSLFGGGGRG